MLFKDYQMTMTSLDKIEREQKPTLEKMLLAYFQEIDPSKIISSESSITIDYPYLNTYWTDDDRTPYFILFNGTKAGFVLVNS